MKLFGRESRVKSRAPAHGARGILCPRPPALGPRREAFTLVELILVLTLLVVVTSLAAPAMSNFIRGRALDSEARRMLALMHAGQSRAVSEGMPMVFWLDEKNGAYGLQAETTGRNGDPKAENLTTDSTLRIAVMDAGSTGVTKFQNLPSVRFLPDGTVDENSPQTLRLMDAKGNALWLVESRNRNGYEINDREK
jgi:type II secretion system protein H